MSRPRKSNRLATVAEIKREWEDTQLRVFVMAVELVEYKARKILLKHPSLDEFVMGMGGWLFTAKRYGNELNPRHIHFSGIDDERLPKYAEPFARMMGEFDRMELKVTGEPIRFTATGPLVKEWGATDGMDGKAVAEKYINGIAAVAR